VHGLLELLRGNVFGKIVSSIKNLFLIDFVVVEKLEAKVIEGNVDFNFWTT
jgi:hypothetical protein